MKPNYHLTNSLLEDSTAHKVAFGFHKGDVGAVSSGRKKVIEQYQSITHKLFIEIKNSAWSDTKDNIRLLGESVKNHIRACSDVNDPQFRCNMVVSSVELASFRQHFSHSKRQVSKGLAQRHHCW